MKKIVVVDLDDTALDYRTAQSAWLRETHGMNIKKEDYTDFNLSKVWNISEEQAQQLIIEFYNTDAFENLAVIPQIIPILQHLYEQGYSLHVMTSRPEWKRKTTETHVKRIEQTAGVTFDAMYLSEWNNKSKPELCKELNAYMLIDDAKKNVEGCVGIVPHLYMPAQPWNAGVAGAIVRGTYEEILAEIKSK